MCSTDILVHIAIVACCSVQLQQLMRDILFLVRLAYAIWVCLWSLAGKPLVGVGMGVVGAGKGELIAAVCAGSGVNP